MTVSSRENFSCVMSTTKLKKCRFSRCGPDTVICRMKETICMSSVKDL